MKVIFDADCFEMTVSFIADVPKGYKVEDSVREYDITEGNSPIECICEFLGYLILGRISKETYKIFPIQRSFEAFGKHITVSRIKNSDLYTKWSEMETTKPSINSRKRRIVGSISAELVSSENYSATKLEKVTKTHHKQPRTSPISSVHESPNYSTQMPKLSSSLSTLLSDGPPTRSTASKTTKTTKTDDIITQHLDESKRACDNLMTLVNASEQMLAEHVMQDCSYRRAELLAKYADLNKEFQRIGEIDLRAQQRWIAASKLLS